ncbi:MAG: hypothetical protein K2Y32_01590 [Candidatus Obscuribacterales bacterium]|nr:hypothetical protein [Candidatus Obscuribacterales bacterium]
MLENRMTTSEPDGIRRQSGDNFRQLAMAECWPGGPVVSNPADCRGAERDTWRRTQDSLPDLQLTNGNEVVAGKTQRNNGNGGNDNERDSYLDRLYS